MTIRGRIVNWLLGYNLERLLDSKDKTIDGLYKTNENSCNLWRKQIEQKNREVLKLKSEVELLGVANRSLDSKIKMIEEINTNLQDKNRKADEQLKRNSFLENKRLVDNIDELKIEKVVLENRILFSEKLEVEQCEEIIGLKKENEKLKKINHEMVININSRGRK